MALDEPKLMELFDEIRIEDCLSGWVTALAAHLEPCRNDRHQGVSSFDLAALAHGMIRRTWRSTDTLTANAAEFQRFMSSLIDECLTPTT
jgi:hypothetical protein